MFNNFHKMVTGVLWGFLFSNIIDTVGTTSPENIFTRWDGIGLIVFIILLGAMSVITYLELIE